MPTLPVLQIGRIAGHVDFYGMPDDLNANRVLQTGVTQLDVELYGLTDESLQLEPDDFFLFIKRETLGSRGA